MKTVFKLFLYVLLFFSNNLFSQKETILSKKVQTNKESVAILNISNQSVIIEESTDGQMHFDYHITFTNYGKKKKQELIDNIKTEVSVTDNTIVLNANSASKIDKETVTLDSLEYITVKGSLFDDYLKKSKNAKSRIAKDSIFIALFNKTDKYANFIQQLYLTKANGEERKFNTKGLKVFYSKFTIKVPPYLKLMINTNNCNVYLNDDLQNKIDIKGTKTSLETKKLLNTKNRVQIYDGKFSAEELFGGDYNLKNVSKATIGFMADVELTTEFSKIEVGEVQYNCKIKDFNSEYWFHNFSNAFNNFEIVAEYSKINLFYPTDDFKLETYGHNTIHYNSDTKIVMQPNKNGEKSKMMVMKPKNEGLFAGNIHLDIVHGIIRTDKKQIKLD